MIAGVVKAVASPELMALLAAMASGPALSVMSDGAFAWKSVMVLWLALKMAIRSDGLADLGGEVGSAVVDRSHGHVNR
jgi:hypothetical protein